jgi:hypothetical protein
VCEGLDHKARALVFRFLRHECPLGVVATPGGAWVRGHRPVKFTWHSDYHKVPPAARGPRCREPRRRARPAPEDRAQVDMVTCAALLLATRRSDLTHGGLSLAALSLQCRIDKHKVARAFRDICLAVGIADNAPRFNAGKTDVGALVRRFAEEYATRLPRKVELPDGERRRLAETALRVLKVAEPARVAEGRSPTAFAAAVVAFAAQVVFRAWQLGRRNANDMNVNRINKLAAAVAGCGERTVRSARCGGAPRAAPPRKEHARQSGRCRCGR